MLSELDCSSDVDASTNWCITPLNHSSQLTEISVVGLIQIGASEQVVSAGFHCQIFQQ